MNEGVEIGWGQEPLWVKVPPGAEIIKPRQVDPPCSLATCLAEALSCPVGSPALRDILGAVSSVSVIVPDHTRKEIDDALLSTVLAQLHGVEFTVTVATGKHPVYSSSRGYWVHDASAADLRLVGRTRNGTPVSYPEHVLNADLRILIGEIRPHYFSGYSGGAKTLFPGVAGVDGIWLNHELKSEPGARLGVVSGNPCRADMEEAAAMAGHSFIINVVRAPNGRIVDIVAGDPIEAHRAGVRRARTIFEVESCAPADIVIVSDRYPVTMNLYQACKLLPPAGGILKEGGTIILAAQCGEGLGPLDVINEKIYRLGSVHSLPSDHRVMLVSQQPRHAVEASFAQFAESVEAAILSAGGGQIAVIPFAGEVLPLLAQRSEA